MKRFALVCMLCLPMTLMVAAASDPTASDTNTTNTSDSDTTDTSSSSGLSPTGIGLIAAGGTVAVVGGTVGVVKGVQAIKIATINADNSIARTQFEKGLGDAEDEYTDAKAAFLSAKQTWYQAMQRNMANAKSGGTVDTEEISTLKNAMMLKQKVMNAADNNYKAMLKIKNRPADVNDAEDDLTDAQEQLQQAQSQLDTLNSMDSRAVTTEELQAAEQNVTDMQDAVKVAQANYESLLTQHGIDAEGNPLSSGSDASLLNKVQDFNDTGGAVGDGVNIGEDIGEGIL